MQSSVYLIMLNVKYLTSNFIFVRQNEFLSSCLLSLTRKLKLMNTSLININERIVQDFIEQIRPPIEIRDELDLGYSYQNNVIEIFEIRPRWDNPNEIDNLSLAKIKYVKTQKIWKLYWMRGSGKWQSYEPFPESSHLEEILSVIDDDEYGCFKG